MKAKTRGQAAARSLGGAESSLVVALARDLPPHQEKQLPVGCGNETRGGARENHLEMTMAAAPPPSGGRKIRRCRSPEGAPAASTGAGGKTSTGGSGATQ